MDKQRLKSNLCRTSTKEELANGMAVRNAASKQIGYKVIEKVLSAAALENTDGDEGSSWSCCLGGYNCKRKNPYPSRSQSAKKDDMEAHKNSLLMRALVLLPSWSPGTARSKLRNWQTSTRNRMQAGHAAVRSMFLQRPCWYETSAWNSQCIQYLVL